MSVEAVSWAINKAPVGGNVTARMILVSLADKADEYGRDAWKYTSAIADSIRKSDATVFRTLAWLEEIGVIERGDQRLVDHYPESARPVVWNLRLDLVQEPIERQKRKGRAGRPCKQVGDPEPRAGTDGGKDGKTLSQNERGFSEPAAGQEETPSHRCEVPPLTGERHNVQKHTYPSAPTGHLPADGETPGKEDGDDSAVDADAGSVADALKGMRSKLGLPAPEPTARDLRHASRLLDRVAAEHGGDRAQALGAVLDVIGWMPRNRFWLRRILNARLLDSQWRGILNDFAVDRLGAGDVRDEARAGDAGAAPAQAKRHRHTWMCRHVLDRLGATGEAVSSDDALNRRAFAVADELNRRDGLPVLDRGPQPAVPDVERHRLDEARRAHGGSMFAGAAGYVPGPAGPAGDGIWAEP